MTHADHPDNHPHFIRRAVGATVIILGVLGAVLLLVQVIECIRHVQRQTPTATESTGGR